MPCQTLLPMTSTAPPVAAAAKQKHQHNDDEDHFHRKSPFKVMTSNREQPVVGLVPSRAEKQGNGCGLVFRIGNHPSKRHNVNVLMTRQGVAGRKLR
jgi:hypothetical protein